MTAPQLGQRIKELRLALDITQADFARRCGWAQARQSQIENGIPLSHATLERIARATNTDLHIEYKQKARA